MDHQTWSAEQAATTVTVDGHEPTVAYFEAGTGNDGPPVVFLDGIPTWSYMCRDVLDPVASDRPEEYAEHLDRRLD